MTEATPARAWRVVLEKIESDLLEGRLGPGDRIQPERELATTLGVGRSSVREALRVLEVMGLIRTGTGSGPTAGAIVTARPHGGLAQLMRLQTAAHAFPIPDVFETRVLLEEWIATTLAARDDVDLSEAAATIRATEAPDLTPDEFLALDTQFHMLLAEAAGNAVVSATMTGLRSSIERYVRSGTARIADWPSMAARLRAEHAGVLEAIEAGDADAARERVRGHIAGYYSEAGYDAPAVAD